MKYLLIAAACMLLLQCNKSPFSDLSGSGKLRGIAIIYDTLSGKTIASPAKNIKVYLKYAAMVTGYLTAASADAQAQYVFNGIDLNKSYKVYASTDTGTVKYYGELAYDSATFSAQESDTLKLYAAAQGENGIHMIVIDKTGGRLGDITAWVFASPSAFNADLSSGKSFDMVTNENGIANRYNIAPITYYIRVKTQRAGLTFAGETAVSVPENGIKTVVLTLADALPNRNGIELKILDQYSTPVNGATSYFYKNGSAFLMDTVSYSNFFFKLTSDASGLASDYFVDPATYFVRTIKVINKDTLLHADTILVNNTTITTKTIFLK